MVDELQAVYELREARSEISRHHVLIAELREALEWALTPRLWLSPEEKDRREKYLRFLNRQVS